MAAAARKLQKEIDTVLKKVDEGIDEFAEFLEQATASDTRDQKERLGEELKKSIHKLQRSRVQIREWMGQSAVQASLQAKFEDAKKRIENDMQRYKDFERELKTKAFSTFSLRRCDDGELEDTDKMKDWLSQTIQTLSDQRDQFEADLEVLAKKKSLSNAQEASQGQLQELLERHQWHIRKLELVLRAVDNGTIEVSELADVQESVDVYVEGHMEPECYHDEALYDCFDLVEATEQAAPPLTPNEASNVEECDTLVNKHEEAAKKTKDKDKEKRRKDEKKDKKKETIEKKAPAPSAPQRTPTQPAMASSTGSDAADARASVVNLPIGEAKVQEEQLLSEADEFICKICIHVVGCSPKLTSCSHLFCGDCIAQWFAQHPGSQSWAQRALTSGPERVVPCPMCKQPLGENRDLFPLCGETSRGENLLLWRMLSSLKIMCSNHPKARRDGKCDWIGEYGSYQKHVQCCKNLSLGDGPCSPTAAPSSSTDGPRAVMEPHAAQAAKGRPSATPVQSPAPASPSTVATSTMALPAAAASSAAATSRVVPAAKQVDGTGSGVHAPAGGRAAVVPTPYAARPVPPVAAEAKTPVSLSLAGARPAEHLSMAQSPQPQQQNQQATRDSAVSVQQLATKNVADGSNTIQAKSSFEPSGSSMGNMVPIRVGDFVQIIEKHASGWAYVKNLSLTSSATATGWAPAWAVQSTPSANSSASKPDAAGRAKEAVKARPVAPVLATSASIAPSVAAAPVAPAPVSAPVAQPAPVVHRPAVEASTAPQVQPTALRAIVSAAFTATSPSQLTLTPADFVDVIERHATGWTYGSKMGADGSSVEGWFPEWAIAQKR